MASHTPEPTHTLEGWHMLHDFRRLDLAAWQAASEETRRAVWEELARLLADWRALDAANEGGFGVYEVIGHKADLLFLHLRPTTEGLLDAERALNQTRFAAFTTRPYSFYSIVELGSQTGPLDPASPYVKPRLTPEVPKSGYVCFYPMNKRREGEDNWYMLSAKERGELMQAHGQTGRKYQGKVRQVISGAQGLDDWEWGVDLFSEDPVQFKKIVYEMRFDEVSARFAEFGPFFVGRYLDDEGLRRLLRP